MCVPVGLHILSFALKLVKCTKTEILNIGQKKAQIEAWTEADFKCHCHSNAPLILCLHKKKKRITLSAHPANVSIFLRNCIKRQTEQWQCVDRILSLALYFTLAGTICAVVSLQHLYKTRRRSTPTHAHQKLCQCSAVARGGRSCLTSYSHINDSCIGILITCFPP